MSLNTPLVFIWQRCTPVSAAQYRCFRASVGPDLAILCTLGNFLKPLATINLLKSPTVFGNFCKGVKIYHFSSEIIFGQLLPISIWAIFSGHTGRCPSRPSEKTREHLDDFIVTDQK